jgi:hypothetical protein
MDAEQGGNHEHEHEEQEQDDEILVAQQQEPQQPIMAVAPTDVILGRGLGPRQHAGNRRYKLTVEMHRARYEAAGSRPDKTRIADEIVGIVKQTGRFLKRDADNNTWVEVDDLQARAKVGQVCYLLKSLVGLQILVPNGTVYSGHSKLISVCLFSQQTLRHLRRVSGRVDEADLNESFEEE